ncbi:MAG: helix-turn-helix transcriptional regulator [Bacteroidota bacterium]|nr:helix-turn-helix transcriptional regulator [Bacteroidota bacterium]MDP4233824.1 helix-turn-helix transcriptional regulator [Bacteroidota bacterium]MDP4242477.1 helix-turn-helix transcriptional regulator [Bacteroidota bacterium]MDP4289065.1 helix-turn-helix transcriptional regulator [Bacteroidota bacterium]
MDLLVVTGRNIRFYRKLRKWSIEKLAEEARVSPAWLGELERGRENVSVKTIQGIAKALKIAPNILLIQESHKES